MSISNIFFVIAAVIILIARTFNSQNKSAKQQPKKPQHIDTDINIDDISSDAIDNIKPAKPVSSAPAPVHTTMPGGGYPAAVVKPKAATAKPKSSVKTAKNTPKTAPNEADEDRFDLEKAVIYSEILTPKFKSEDIY